MMSQVRSSLCLFIVVIQECLFLFKTSLNLIDYGLKFSSMNMFKLLCYVYGVHYEDAWIPSGFMCLLIHVGRGSILGSSPKYKGDSAQF